MECILIVSSGDEARGTPLRSLRHGGRMRRLGRLAQLVRALASHARGQWFKSTTAHHAPQRPSPHLAKNHYQRGEQTRVMRIKYAGLALMVGVVLAWIGGLFMPGYTFINPVDQTDFPAARDALGDWAVLAHWMNLIMFISMLLMIFGFLVLYPVASRQAGVGGRLLQFGIITSVIEWSHPHHRRGDEALRDPPDAAQQAAC